MYRTTQTLGIIACLALTVSSACATPLAASDFGGVGFTAGNLVGQGSWAQYNTPTTNPIQVSGGSVVLPPSVVANDQDAYLGFSSQVLQPVSGTTFLYFAIDFKVGSASATNTSYFVALNTLTDGTTSGNFQNARMVLKDNGLSTGFQFGTRVNGQAGYALTFGSTSLNYNQTYSMVAEIALVAGSNNDYINIYINPTTSDFSTLTPYTSSVYGSGAATDPLYGGMLISQFGTASVPQSGVSVSKMVASSSALEAYNFVAVPEPREYGVVLGGLCIAALVIRRRR